MPVSYGHNLDNDQKIDVEKVKDAINAAIFSFEVTVAKGAPIKPKSRFADQPEVDPKYQRVKASLTIDVKSLPPLESQFLLDAFDRFASQQNGKLVLSENCHKNDFDEDKVSSRIADYAHQKIDKLISGLDAKEDFEIPPQQVIPQNEGGRFMGWLRRSADVSNGMSM